jgi:predicted RNase H-like nuclease (RuvC/YqgF family)
MLLSPYRNQLKNVQSDLSHITSRKIKHGEGKMISLPGELSDFEIEVLLYLMQDIHLNIAHSDGSQNGDTNLLESKDLEGIDSLKKELKIKNQEIKSLRRELNGSISLTIEKNIAETINGVGADWDNDDSLKNDRIRELAKRAKRLTVSFQREKSKNQLLQEKLKEFQGRDPIVIKSPEKSSNGDLKRLKDILAQVYTH